MNLSAYILTLAFLASGAPNLSPIPYAFDLLSRGRADDAISTLNREIQHSPTDDSYHLLCRAHYDVQDWNSAIAACEKAASLNPKSSRNHLWLGRSYGEKASSSNFMTAIGLAKKVRSEFETAVSLDPSNVEARADLAEYYVEAPGFLGGGRDKAERQAVEMAKFDSSKAHFIDGRIAEKNDGDKTRAEREYQAAIEASKGAGLDWLNLGFFYKRTRRMDDMEQALRNAVAAPLIRPEVIVEAAETLIRSDRNLPLAESWLNQYLSGTTVELAPTFKAYYWLGQAQQKQGDSVAAAQSYRSALSLAKGYSRAQEALNHVQRMPQ